MKTVYRKILPILKTLEKTAGKYWNISRKTGIFLNLIIRDHKYRTALEIGTSTGYSALHLAEALHQNNGRLYTIESNLKNRFPLAQKTFEKAAKLGLKNITLISGHAPQDIPKIPEKFDFAFFDATKNEHLSYFTILSPRIKKGGMIVTDNAISHKKELSVYIKHVKAQKAWHSKEINIGTGLLVSLKL